jgi:hypothetical protein
MHLTTAIKRVAHRAQMVATLCDITAIVGTDIDVIVGADITAIMVTDINFSPSGAAIAAS